MTPISIEQDPPRTSECGCCGGTTTHLTRFVYRDGDAYAVYYAAFSDDHDDGVVSVLIGLGEWGEDALPDERVAFAAKIRTSSGQFEVMIVGRDDALWRDVTFLGEILSRAEALAHPRLKDVFELTDRIVHEDDEVHAYLERAGS